MKRVAVVLTILVVVVLSVACASTATPTIEEPGPTAAPSDTPTQETAATEEEVPATDAVQADAFDIACVAVDTKEDQTWNLAHWEGCNAAADAVGAELGWADSVPEGAEAERVIRDFAEKGYDLIFTTSFGFMDPTIAVAEEYPDTWFVHISGYKTAPNVSTVFGRQYQGKYLAGLVAGAMSESCIIGLPAAFAFPEVIRLANAWFLGAREGARQFNDNCDDLTMKVVLTNSWYSPPLEAEASEALIDAGADVIGHDVGTTKNCEVAQARGAYCVGYHTDFCEVAGLCDVQLTASIWDWGDKYIEIAQAVSAGTYETESYWGGIEDGIVDIAPIHDDVPDEVVTYVEERRAAIESGQWDVFCADDEPIRDRNGAVRVDAGECLSDQELGEMEWFVEGIEADTDE